jgi:cysteine desulfurase
MGYRDFTIFGSKTMASTYLDWAATSPPDPEILEQVRQVSLTHFANPSSMHAAGREAAGLLARCRERLAGVLGCLPEEVVFTSGGTEANNMALFGLLPRRSGRKLVLSGIEHDSVYLPATRLRELGFEVSFVPAERNGRVQAGRILGAVEEGTAMVALMLVNNETGARQPLAEVAQGLSTIRRRTGRHVLLHCDAVQGFGKLPFQPAALGVDSAALSGHKLGAPRGVGVLYVRRGGGREFLYRGGGQESQMRPGTENLPGIYGLVLAAERAAARLQSALEQTQGVCDALVEALERIPGVVLLPPSRRTEPSEGFSPYILSLAAPPLPGEVLVRALGEGGYLVSTGAACSSGKKDRFRVLEQSGVPPELARCAIRVSLGPATSREEVLGLADALRRKVPELTPLSAR